MYDKQQRNHEDTKEGQRVKDLGVAMPTQQSSMCKYRVRRRCGRSSSACHERSKYSRRSRCLRA